MRKFLEKLWAIVVLSVWIGVASPASAQEMTFKVMTDRAGCAACIWLQMSGEITAETATKFKAFLQQNPFVSVVQIDSVGGNLAGAIEMGEQVRSRKLAMVVGAGSVRFSSDGDEIATRVPGYCMSACAFILAAGQERSQVAGSKIGVHQFYGGADVATGAEGLEAGQRITGRLITYLARMGVDSAVISKASSAGPDEVYVLSNAEALRYRLLTSIQEQYSAAGRGRPSYSAATVDPFGDADRVAPAAIEECGIARYSRADGNFTSKQLQEMNRYGREVCEKYFDALGELSECREAWDKAYNALQYVTANKHLGLSPQYSMIPSVSIDMLYASQTCRRREFDKQMGRRN